MDILLYDYGLLVKQLVSYKLSLSHDVVLIHKTKSTFLLFLSKSRLHHVLLGLSSIFENHYKQLVRVTFPEFLFLGLIPWLPKQTLAIDQLW